MKCSRCSLFVTFVVLTVDQFVVRDDGPNRSRIATFVEKIAHFLRSLFISGEFQGKGN